MQRGQRYKYFELLKQQRTYHDLEVADPLPRRKEHTVNYRHHRSCPISWKRTRGQESRDFTDSTVNPIGQELPQVPCVDRECRVPSNGNGSDDDYDKEFIVRVLTRSYK